MTLMQWRIWALAACGKFFVGFIIFVTGVALPLISREFGIPPGEYGLISAASLLGILIGAAGLGGLSDYFGRRTMFIAEMFIFLAFLVVLVLSNNFALLIFCLFGLGLALGCDYPTAHLIISENICTANRGRLVLAAYTFQAVGALSGTAIGFAVLTIIPKLDAWRWMYGLAILPAVAVTIGRFSITESANWLHIRGAHDRAEAEVGRLLSRAPPYPAKLRWVVGARPRPSGPPNRPDTQGCSAEIPDARPYRPACPGFCRTSAATASPFSRRRFSDSPSAARSTISAASTTSY